MIDLKKYTGNWIVQAKKVLHRIDQIFFLPVMKQYTYFRFNLSGCWLSALLRNLARPIIPT